MERPDPPGRAMFDYQHGRYERGDLRYVDGERTEIGHPKEYYFGDPFDPGETIRERGRRVLIDEGLVYRLAVTQCLLETEVREKRLPREGVLLADDHLDGRGVLAVGREVPVEVIEGVRLR